MPAERIRLQGRVQGVGMRPTLYRLARERGLRGAIRNDGQGVELDLHGPAEGLEDFLAVLPGALPPLARLDAMQRQPLAQATPKTLAIEASTATGCGAVVLPDAATCPDCLAEIRDPRARRYRYAFTNCTHCGPRLSIQQRIPWDRPGTSMAGFGLCPACAAEYADPADRRYHAQPIACPDCGPRCELRDAQGAVLASGAPAIDAAAGLLRQGKILAIKGLGGFHLACDAREPGLLQRLRQRKRRPAKPLALMLRDLGAVERQVRLGDEARAWLVHPAAPIVLLPRRSDCGLPAELAPGLDQLGVMLPHTPLQHLLLEAFDGPLVMTSGNRAGEPPCVENDEARERLVEVADAFLLHDRPILNRVDDSLLQLVRGRPQVLRAARGFAPCQRRHASASIPPVLALGGQLKACFALLRERDWIVSQHIGDLEQADNLRDFEIALARYQTLFDFTPAAIAVDAHPAYLSRQLGRNLSRRFGLPLIAVQHHHAHAVSVLAEAGRQPEQGPWLALSCDGLGYGENGELWGGEFLSVNFESARRLGRWRPAALLGGVAGLREPWRNLYAVLDQLGGWTALSARYPGLARRLSWPQPPALLDQLLRDGEHCPPCSSLGRAFDALAWLLGLSPDRISYEAEAALRLQARAQQSTLPDRYTLVQDKVGDLWELDWRPLWRAMLDDAEAERSAAEIAGAFHRALAEGLVALAARILDEQGLGRDVVLCGGVFQNPLLLELCERALMARGLRALSAAELPGNDGGLALGQAWVAASRLKAKEMQPCA